MDGNTLVTEHMDAIREGVYAFAKRVPGAADIADDLIGDAILRLLDGKAAKFDPTRGDARTFVRMVAWQTARDAWRSCTRGGQYGKYEGNQAVDVATDVEVDGEAGEDKRHRGGHIPTESTTALDLLLSAERASVLDSLTDPERSLLTDPAGYAAAHGISRNAAYVRKSKLLATMKRAA